MIHIHGEGATAFAINMAKRLGTTALPDEKQRLSFLLEDDFQSAALLTAPPARSLHSLRA